MAPEAAAIIILLFPCRRSNRVLMPPLLPATLVTPGDDKVLV
jgi:hypothetical protein